MTQSLKFAFIMTTIFLSSQTLSLRSFASVEIPIPEYDGVYILEEEGGLVRLSAHVGKKCSVITSDFARDVLSGEGREDFVYIEKALASDLPKFRGADIRGVVVKGRTQRPLKVNFLALTQHFLKGNETLTGVFDGGCTKRDRELWLNTTLTNWGKTADALRVKSLDSLTTYIELSGDSMLTSGKTASVTSTVADIPASGLYIKVGNASFPFIIEEFSAGPLGGSVKRRGRLRFDGIYGGRKLGSPQSLRFYDDGIFIVVASSGAHQLAGWFNKNHPGVSRGTYSLDEEGVLAEITWPNGRTVVLRGKFEGSYFMMGEAVGSTSMKKGTIGVYTFKEVVFPAE